jgi:hypothetical protein
MKKTLISALLVTLGLGTLLWAESPQAPAVPAKAKPESPATTPPAQTSPSTTLPTPLPAEIFQGKVREAYKAAEEIPDILAGLACYCGCDKSHGHRNLLDCFVDDHGAG